jgi:diaminohydroxyphosphoribosylaminopyrimidine deaminase/5-amino-6-(5-phosphoribosylamino)uracil reductase
MLDEELDGWHMRRALELAERGRGHVEPNPLVGCVIAQNGQVVGEGWHGVFGGPHAEVVALASAGPRAQGATAYVTLEPCCHHGKTPPCTDTLIQAGIRRVVAGMRDPFAEVAGQGFAQLTAAGIEVDSGLLEEQARQLNRPYLKLIATGLPWVIAKWAMTCDGKLADQDGRSQWISGDASRALVHELRGRVDAILVGKGTIAADDPLLTARPRGARIARRVVLDSRGTVASNSQILKTLAVAPVIVAVGPECPMVAVDRLRGLGCEVLPCAGTSLSDRARSLLSQLGDKRFTNVLVEGGSHVLGSFFTAGLIDEVWAFIAPRLAGGSGAVSPIGGTGISLRDPASQLQNVEIRTVGEDVLLRGFVAKGN